MVRSNVARSHRSGRRAINAGGNRYRHVVVPGVKRRPRPAAWQLVGAATAILCSVAALAWVFTGGADTVAWSAIWPAR